MSKYVIVTESGNDVPQDIVDKHGIHVVPMHVTFDGISRDDGTFPTTKIIEHYERTKELPKTSGCTPGDFSKAFDEIFAENPDVEVIYLAYSAGTTCSFESARSVAAGRANADQIHMYDTKAVAAGAGLIVQEIAELLEREPEMPLELLERSIADRIERQRMAFIPGGLEFLRAGGRLSNAAFLGATLLRIKPTIEIQDGALVATKKRRGNMEKAVLGLIDDFMAEEPKDLRRCNLIYGEGIAEELKQKAEARCREYGFKDIRWVSSGGVIFSHSGPGSFAICAFAEQD